MFRIIKMLFGCLVFAFSFIKMNAHTHKVSSVYLINQNDVWHLQVTASFAAYQYEMLQSMPEERIQRQSPQEIQQWILTHLKNNLELSINGNKTRYGDVFVQVGHEVKVKILLNDIPSEVDDIAITNAAFLNSGSTHQSLFKVIIDKKPSERFLMQEGNRYTLQLSVDGDKVTPALNIMRDLKENILPISTLIVSVVLILLFYKKKQKLPTARFALK